MSNLTGIFHKEIISNTQIISSFCGKFIPTLLDLFCDNQICIQYSSYIKIYSIIKSDEKKDAYDKLNLLNTYKIFDTIEYCEKFNSLLNNNDDLNSIILALSDYKISIIEYDLLYSNFNTLALYSMDKYVLSGRINIENNIKIIPSLNHNLIIFLFDDNKINILRQKGGTSSKKKIPKQSHSYTDTLNGNKFFFPSIYLNDLNTKYNIYKIINIYIPQLSNKNSEIFHVYILYIESTSNNNFMRNNVSLGLLSYNLKNNVYIEFKIIFAGLDENIFDFTVLENEETKEKTAIMFSAYNIQIVNLKKNKFCTNLIFNEFYLSKLNQDKDKYQLNTNFMNFNIDLRGGGFLEINSNYFIFGDSLGKLYFVQYNTNTDIKIESLNLDQEKNQFNVPYNKILTPYKNTFFLSSPFSDAILLNLIPEEKIFKTKDKIINYSPLINFHLVNDDIINDKKFVFTYGYGEKSFISFAYRQFLYHENIINIKFQDDIECMKSIYNDNNEYTKYILCKLKNQKLIIFHIINNDINNISDKVEYNKDINIINFHQIYINTENNYTKNEKLIILIFENEINFYNKDFVLIATLDKNVLEKISKDFMNTLPHPQFSKNFIMTSNINEKKFFLCGLYDTKLEKNSGIIEIAIGPNLFLRCKDLSEYINKNKISTEFIRIKMCEKMYMNKYNLLMIYRNNIFLEIYDITHALEYNNNDNKMIIEEEQKENNLFNIKSLLNTNLINYVPPILLNDTLNKNILYRSNSNINIDFSNSINNLLNPNSIELKESNSNLNINKNNSEISNEMPLKKRLSFSVDCPDFVYFGNLGNLIILALTLKSGFLIIYTLFISEMTEDNQDIKSIGFKKIFIEKLDNIDYKNFFRHSVDSLFMPFDCLNNKSGIIFNLENNKKIIYEINDEINILNDEKNNSSWMSFCEFNHPVYKNGFLIYDQNYFKFCNLYKNYNLSNHSLLIKTNSIKRFPHLLTYMPEYSDKNLYYNYILIEKEFLFSNKFIYYMTLRLETEETKPITELKFEPNEVITECTIIELQKIFDNSNINNMNKNFGSNYYIALGINIIDDNTSEETKINAKIKLYQYNKINNIFELQAECDGFQGIITLIQNLNNLNNMSNIILISEGSGLNIYQFNLNLNEKLFEAKKIFSIPNSKNMIVSNRIININKNKLFLAGDIMDSFSLYCIKPNIINNALDMHLELKENLHMKITSCNLYLINNKKYGIIFDENNNGYIYFLENNTPLRICDFNLNKNINEIRNKSNESKILYYSSNQGSIGIFTNIDNDIYEKLNLLCEFICYHFPFNCGVNPGKFYEINDKKNYFLKKKGRFIDVSLLEIFMKLSDKFQDIICSSVINEDKNDIIRIIKDLIYC